MLSCLQSLEALQPDKMLRHLRRLKPKVHDVTFSPGELLPAPNLSISHIGDIRTKDPSSCGNGANADAETLRVATLSTTFGGRCEFYPRRRSLLDCIASVSTDPDTPCISSNSRSRQWAITHKGELSTTTVPNRVSEPLRCCSFNINLTRKLLGRESLRKYHISTVTVDCAQGESVPLRLR